MRRRLVFAFLLVAMTWVAFQFHTSGPDDPIDHGILIVITLTAALYAAIQIKWTEWWDTNVIAVLFFVLGVAVLFSGGVWARLIANQPADVCNPRAIVFPCSSPVVVPEWVNDLGRSFLVYAGLLGCYSALRYAWNRLCGKREATWPEVDRRNGLPGRRATDFAREAE